MAILKLGAPPLGGVKPPPEAKTATVVGGSSPRVIVPPKRGRVTRASDVDNMFLSLLIFGSWGTGKTYCVADLLRQGFKICLINTDIGNNGTLSVRMALRKQNLAHLLENLYVVDLRNDAELQEFLIEPKAFFPDIYDVGIDMVFWDGFSWWQQNDLFETVGRIVANDAADAAAQPGGRVRVVSDARTSGNKFEQQEWQIIRNASLKGLRRFNALHNKVTGQLWHKIITCQEQVKSVKKGNDGSVLMETKSPFVSGAAGNFMGGAFDLVIRTTSKTDYDGDEGARKFQYIIQGNQTNMCKVRGFDLPAVMDADMYALWGMLEEQAGIQRGAKSEEVRGEVLVEEGK